VGQSSYEIKICVDLMLLDVDEVGEYDVERAER
jgi:hypothetical protein